MKRFTLTTGSLRSGLLLLQSFVLVLCTVGAMPVPVGSGTSSAPVELTEPEQEQVPEEESSVPVISGLQPCGRLPGSGLAPWQRTSAAKLPATATHSVNNKRDSRANCPGERRALNGCGAILRF